MATIENINVRNKAVLFAKNIYQFCENNKYVNKNYSLRDQIQRAALSIPSNIAE
jgi:four helix bundle protein